MVYNMTKTFADECLERSKSIYTHYSWECARTIIDHDVPELCKRLKRACQIIKDLGGLEADLFGLEKPMDKPGTTVCKHGVPTDKDCWDCDIQRREAE